MNETEITSLLNGSSEGALAVRGTSWASVETLLKTGNFPIYSESEFLCWWPILENWKKSNYSIGVPFAPDGVYRLAALEDEQLIFRPERLVELGVGMLEDELNTLEKYDAVTLAKSWAFNKSMAEIWFEYGLTKEDSLQSFSDIKEKFPHLNPADIFESAYKSKGGILLYLSPQALGKMDILPDRYFSEDLAVSISTFSGLSLRSEFIQKIEPLGSREIEKIDEYMKTNFGSYYRPTVSNILIPSDSKSSSDSLVSSNMGKLKSKIFEYYNLLFS